MYNLTALVLNHLIIVKLPFPIPDPISEYEKTLYPDMNVYLDSVLIPKMLIKLRQGVGRLIRCETDSGVISILDSRAAHAGKYHRSVIDALPNCDVASNIDDIRKFLILKKDEAYFI
ncbi:helicase C-terminal domain-containing protein [Fusibacter sp. 3D3]|uniref:helicase C-terminal domain-containing protein n=1 Tax=Fusibacter sp. 3D3 TaxID=1048380 RepID=UPI0015860BDA|nr:helicase C-terminal domain-containing protein [Fusibacter sp. 3D3]